MHRLHASALVAVVAALAAGCDNVGRAFDRDVTPPDPSDPTGFSNVQVPPARGDARDGRPVVRAANPKGSGWPNTVPIVVEFSESMNEDSLLPTTATGTDGKVILRLEGTTTPLPVVYGFLAGGRLLVLRALGELVSPAQSPFEVVLLPDARDADGQRFSSQEEEILATFTIDEKATDDGRIVAVYPRDNTRDLPRDTDFITVFSRVPNVATLAQTQGNFVLRTSAGSRVIGDVDVPLDLADVLDPRIVRFRPANNAVWAGETTFEFVVTSGITFGSGGSAGVLQFSGRTPFSRFTTVAVPQPVAVTVGNFTPGFPDMVNRQNFATLQLAVEVPAEALAGDRAVARIYGGDSETTATNDLVFFQRTAELPIHGTQTVPVDFTDVLGQLDRPKLDAGPVRYTVQLLRGSTRSGLVRGGDAALLDTVIPSVSSVGPPRGSNGTDLFTELGDIAILGIASEQLGDVDLVIDTPGDPVNLFASRPDGSFLTRALSLGRRTAPVPYSLLVKDRAGNMAAAPSTGVILQRGVITGPLGSELVVEAYDHATMLALPGVEVLVDDEQTPPLPPIRLPGTTTTGPDGRATFSGLGILGHTVTLVLPGYDVVTLSKTTASFVSLPLRAVAPAAAVAMLSGGATLEQAAAGTEVIVGTNLLDDASSLTVNTTPGTSPAPPFVIPPTPIQPSRLQMLSAFGGPFEPTQNPSFQFHACNLGGLNLATPTPPAAPTGPSLTPVPVAFVLRSIGTAIANISPITGINFGESQGLDLNNLVGPPLVRVSVSVGGFSGQGFLGVGFSTLTAPGTFTFNGTISQAIFDVVTPLVSRAWVVSEARDASGRISRTRAALPANGGGAATDQIVPQLIPTISPPAAPSTGPPLVQVFDALDPADVQTVPPTTALTGFLGVDEVVAIDTAGRRWRLLAADNDDTENPPLNDYQFPAPGTQPTLLAGTWVVVAHSRLFLQLTGGLHNFVLGDMLRHEATFARGEPVPFTIK